MKLKMVDLQYVDVGILLLPKPVYRDDKGNLWRYDTSWEEREKISPREELERLLRIHDILPKVIEGDVEFENKIYNWIGVRDKKGTLYRFERVVECPKSRSQKN